MGYTVGMARNRIYALHYGPTWISAPPQTRLARLAGILSGGFPMRKKVMAWTIYRVDGAGVATVREYPTDRSSNRHWLLLRLQNRYPCEYAADSETYKIEPRCPRHSLGGQPAPGSTR